MTTFTGSQLIVEDSLRQSVVSRCCLQVTGPSQLVCLDHGWDIRHLRAHQHLWPYLPIWFPWCYVDNEGGHSSAFSCAGCRLSMFQMHRGVRVEPPPGKFWVVRPCRVLCGSTHLCKRIAKCCLRKRSFTARKARCKGKSCFNNWGWGQREQTKTGIAAE